MSIVSTELLFYKSATVGDTDSNGGVMSTSQVTTGVKNNMLPDVTLSERNNGSVTYRKFFLKVASRDNLELADPYIYVKHPTNGDDRVTLFPGTQEDTQADISSTREYGCGALVETVASGDNELSVTLEAAADLIQTEDVIVIADETNIEFFSGVTVSRNSTLATIALANGDQLANEYTAGAAWVAAVYCPADIVGAIEAWTETSNSGTCDEEQVAVDSIGGIEDDWTLTFTDATTFTVSGFRSGDLGSGAITADFAPINADFSKPYFTIPAPAWGGVWAAGETILFTTHPAAAPFWIKRVVPGGCAAVSANSFIVECTGTAA